MPHPSSTGHRGRVDGCGFAQFAGRRPADWFGLSEANPNGFYLPPASSVNIQLTTTVAALPESPVSNIAAVTPPAGIVDANLKNNVASDGPDVVGVFKSSFE